MIVDVTKIEGLVKPFAFRAGADQIALDTPNYRIAGPVTVEGEIEKHIVSIKVRGNIGGNVTIDCTRCVQPVEHALSIDFDVEYLTEGRLGSEGEHEIGSADLETDELQGNTLDLTQLAREQILLNIPEQFLCQDECKGLCEKCGGNRNLVDCRCGQDEIDPRWAALKNLK
ncbi:MAG: DUF177 domain-containing protein [Acidobacteria bacterium]|nr:DUF177 domain-containing protein [Acidobacteriota bacterium]